MILKQISSRQKEIGLLSIFAVIYITQLILSAKLYILIGMCILVYFIRTRERKYGCIIALLLLYLGKYAFSIKNFGWNPVCVFGYMIKEASVKNETEALTLAVTKTNESTNGISITQEVTGADVEQIAQSNNTQTNTTAQTLPQASLPIKTQDAATNIIMVPFNPGVTKQALPNNISDCDMINTQPIAPAVLPTAPKTAPLQEPQNNTTSFETSKPQQFTPSPLHPVFRPPTTTNKLASQNNNLYSGSVYEQPFPSAVKQPAFQPVPIISFDVGNNQMFSQQKNYPNTYYNQPTREFIRPTNHYKKNLTKKIPVYKVEEKSNTTHSNLEKNKDSALQQPFSSLSNQPKDLTPSETIKERIKLSEIYNHKNEGITSLCFYAEPFYYKTRLGPKLEELQSESFEKQMQKFLNFLVVDGEELSGETVSKWNINSTDNVKPTRLQILGRLLKNYEIKYVSINNKSIVGARRKSGLEQVISKTVDDNGRKIKIPRQDQKEMQEVSKYIHQEPKFADYPLIGIVFEINNNKK